MGELTVSLLPLMIAAAQAPVWVIMVLLLLRRPAGLITAAAFVGGITAVRFTQGAAFGLAVSGAMMPGAANEARTVSAVPQIIIGALLWLVAVRQFRARDQVGPPAWLAKIERVTPLTAFGFGAVLVLVSVKQWAFTLGALGVIREAEVSPAGSTTAYVMYVLGAEALILLPLVVYAVARQRSAAVLDRVGTWLERCHRPIVIAVSAIFGTYFLWKGISGLLG